ncbi:hypothetical protein ACOSP7_017286 [Xanthoceras sorbifolium]
MGPPPSLLPPSLALPVISKDKGKELARVEQPTEGELLVAPSFSDWTLGLVTVGFLEQALTLLEDFLTMCLSQHIEEDQGVDLCHCLLRYSLMLCKELQAYKNKLASKATLDKKLTEEAKRCQALRKEIEQEMNAS